MNRRSFLSMASLGVAGSSVVYSLYNKPVVATNFEVSNNSDLDPTNMNSLILGFDYFEITPLHIDDSHLVTLDITLEISDQYESTKVVDLDLKNGRTMDVSEEIGNLLIEGIDINNASSTTGSIIVKVSHPDVSERYKRSFLITGDDKIVYDFESGSYTENWNDVSQSNANPSVNKNYNYNGSYSLNLESDPGSSTKNAVRTKTASSFKNAKIYFNMYRIDGDQNGFGLELKDKNDSQNRLNLFYSEWNNRYLKFRELTSNTKNEKNLINSPLSTNSWYEIDISIKNDSTVKAVVNGTDSVEIDTTLDWTNRDKYVEFNCNAWDYGHSLYTAWDSVELF